MNIVKENLLKIQEEIKQNSVLYKPNIIAVTKYFDKSKIIEAYEAGLRDFGESKVIEAIEKIQSLPLEIRENSKFHLIGHLQGNKVKNAVGNFDYIHSIDSLKLATAVSEEALKQGIKQKVLIQVNNAREEQKFGFLREEILEFFGEIKSLDGLEIIGLMNIAPLDISKEKLKYLFEDIIRLRDELEKKFDCKLKEISMGMSGDYKEAVVAGATIIRIGRRLFSK